MEVNNPTPPDLDEFVKQVLVQQQKLQRQLGKFVPDDVLPAIALAPYIPAEVAEHTDSFGNLQNAAEAGFLRIGPGPATWSQPVFWMDRPMQDSALAQLKARRPKDYAPVVMRSLSDSAKRILASGKDRIEAEPTLWRWTTLAAASNSPASFKSALMSHVDAALNESESAHKIASPEARAWIEAAEPFGAALEGSFDAAVAAAKRRFELFHRYANDRARLRNYHPRPELEAEFFTLLSDKDKWALHFIGAGGLGKTMFIRHLALEVAPKARVAVSRIDFDYLNPEYPDRDPVLLLKALADEFRLQGGPDGIRAFDSFERVCDSIYHRLEAALREGFDVRPSLANPDVAQAIRTFAEGLAALPTLHPVLILDTCEELARVQPGAQLPRNVEHTFELLKSLHDAYAAETERRSQTEPSCGLRVIFSGRRSLPDMPWLRVYRIEGFAARDAEEFLKSYRDEQGRTVRPELIPGIMNAAEANGRYSPWDIDTYAAWAAADSTLSEDKLRTSGPLLYMRERIVDRLNPLVRRIFPALAIVGRFDREILKFLIGTSANPANDLMEVLAQEWVLPDAAGAIDTWRLDDLFRQRALLFYKTEDRAAAREARALLAEHLPELTLTRKFSLLTPQIFMACLEVLSDTPAKAAEWWDLIEQRIAAETEWAWASDLIRFLQPEPGVACPIRAALMATLAAVKLHTGYSDATAEWETVVESLKDYPLPDGSRRLQFRADCALGKGPVAMFDRAQLLSAQDAASALAWAERLTERQESNPFDSNLSQGAADETLPDQTRLGYDPVCESLFRLGISNIPDAPDLRAFANCLIARRLGIWNTEGRYFSVALGICAETNFDNRQTWLDWIRPDELERRILLEFARAFPNDFPGSYEHRAREFLTPPLASIDSERLASAWLGIWEKKCAFSANPLRDQFTGLFASSISLASAIPKCRAHQSFPPFVTALIEARGLGGEPAQALQDLAPLQAGAAKWPADVILRLDVAFTKIVRRMRLTSEGCRVPRTVLESKDPAIARLAAITQAFDASDFTVSDDIQSDDALEAAELAFLRGQRSRDPADLAFVQAHARDDESACFETIMLRALTEARAGALENARAIALEARGRYEKLTAGTQAPPWAEILKAAESGSVATLLDGMGARPVVWRPWVVRLLACLTPPPRDDLAKWIAANDTGVSEGVKRVAPELDFVIHPAVGAPAAKTPAAPQSRAKNIAYFFIGLAAIAGMIAAMVKGGLLLYHAYVKGLAYLGIGFPKLWRVISFLVVLPCVIYLISRIPAILSFLLNLYARLARIESVVDLARDSPDLNRPLLVPTTGRWRIVYIGFITTPWRTFELRASDKDRHIDIYKDLHPASEPPANKLLRSLTRIFPGLTFHRELTVDDRTAAAPWEAIQVGRFLIFTRRITRDVRLTSLPEWRAPVEVLTWGGNAVPPASKDWGVRFHGTVGSFLGEFGEFAASNPKTGVLRIVGVPLESGSDLVIQVKAHPEDYLVRPADVLRRYPALRLVILQCPPGEVHHRLSSDRRCTAILKRIAAEMFSAGVPIVIAIPVLPEQASNELLDAIYKVLARRPWNAVPQLETAITLFQRKSLKKISADRADAEEIALDVCLYARRSVSFKLAG